MHPTDGTGAARTTMNHARDGQDRWSGKDRGCRGTRQTDFVLSYKFLNT